MLSVVIPLYNEEENIAPLCEEVRAALAGRPLEIVLVDDKSSDGTLARIPRLPGIRVIELAKNTGQSAAMYAGIQAARGSVIALMDGDRQNDPADVPKMLLELERADPRSI
jgi:dolichol-phosphate mannosyltransferase